MVPVLSVASWPDAVIALAVPFNTALLLYVARRQTAAKDRAAEAVAKAEEAAVVTHTLLRKVNGTAVDPAGKIYTLVEVENE